MNRNNGKHAYLIIAHKVDETFRTLLRMLDDEKNDIFIHMDKKNRGYDNIQTEKICKSSKVYHTKRINVHWGGYSLVDVEIALLEYACDREKYEYYHLLSGNDLPIKSQKVIHNFFNNANTKEFVHIENADCQYLERVRYYYYFSEFVGRGKGNYFIKNINRGIVAVQKILKIQRNKNIIFQKGSQWFSITDEFARYVISKKKWIRKVFKYTKCPDEMVMQTLLINSEFRYSLCNDNSDRMIDWKRGNPYVFRIEDYDSIIESKQMFARKFIDDTDCEIIKRIEQFCRI